MNITKHINILAVCLFAAGSIGAAMLACGQESAPQDPWITQLRSEAEAAELEAEIQHHIESPVCISGRHIGGGEQVDKPYTSEDEEEIEMLACAIYTVSSGYSKATQRMIGDVVLNRVLDNRFPDNLTDVLLQRGQWGFTERVEWPDRAYDPDESGAVEQCYRVAIGLFWGEHSALYGERYIWAAPEPQGHSVVQSDGIFFGR